VTIVPFGSGATTVQLRLLFFPMVYDVNEMLQKTPIFPCFVYTRWPKIVSHYWI